MSTNNPEPLYDGSLSLIEPEPVKRALIHCPECEAEFFGPRAATAFIEHSCTGHETCPECGEEFTGLNAKFHKISHQEIWCPKREIE